jgi:two-component system sensor histidine kinase MtrB
VPSQLRQLVKSGQPGVQRGTADGRPALIVGVPLTGGMEFYEVASLQELDRTLHVMALILTLAATITVAAGATIGWYTTRRALRPLTSVVHAARDIAAGDFTTRLDPVTEPELRQLTTAFNQMVDQLADRLERDRRFAADVSHELRSPLQTLSAAASVLGKRCGSLDDRSATAVALVTQEIDRFQALVADLLELARGDQPVERSDVPIAEVLRQVCQARGIPPDVLTMSGDALTWPVDRRRFTQTVRNLLDNAVQHGGGPVAIRAGQHSETLFVEVDDEGPGVHPDDREAIFGRFVRGRGAGARGIRDGTGLGLALAAAHVTAHGGRITVSDRPGGGARFRAEFPRTER